MTHNKPVMLTADCLAEVRRLTDDYAAATHLLADRDAQIERLTAERDAANAVIDELLAVYTYKGLMLPARQRRRLAAIDAARALRKGTT